MCTRTCALVCVRGQEAVWLPLALGGGDPSVGAEPREPEPGSGGTGEGRGDRGSRAGLPRLETERGRRAPRECVQLPSSGGKSRGRGPPPRRPKKLALRRKNWKLAPVLMGPCGGRKRPEM